MKIGKIVATESHPTTIDEFSFWTKVDLIISPFDVVKVSHINNSFTYGVVREISHITDSAGFLANFISSDFGDLNANSNTDRIGMNYVRATVIHNSDDIYTPVLNGSDVSLATKEDVEAALGLEELQSGEYITCGSIEMYEKLGPEHKLKIPVKLNTRFLLGPDGAHLNISGISGLASKTSYTMFLIKSIQEHYLRQDKATRGKVAFVVLNVKGADLLAIDRPREYKNEKQKELIAQKYSDLGLSTEPVKNVKYFYPYSGKDLPTSLITSEVYEKQKSSKQAFSFKYLYEEDNVRLDLLFSDIDDPNLTMESIISTIATSNEFRDLRTWDEFLEKIDSYTQTSQSNGQNRDIQIASWKKFKRIVRKNIENNAIFAQRIAEKQREVRLREAISKIQGNDIFVIDIAKLDGGLQSFVFGDVIKAVSDLIQGQYDDSWDVKNPPDKIVVFVDELNKYAAADISNSPLLTQIRDVAERGRSLGIVLFSAEQFKSAVNSKVTGNCSTHAYGRTNSVELSHSSYKFVSNTDKTNMTRLRQGEYIIQNPVLKTLLKIRFPEPVYFQFE